MNEQQLFNQRLPSKASIGILSRVHKTCLQFTPAPINRYLHRLGNRLTLLVVALVSVLTFCTAFLVINIMDDILLHSMIQRGAASVYAIAAAAGYSINTTDQQAIDNLVYKGKRAQDNLIYVAILDNSHQALAHTHTERRGTTIPRLYGEQIQSDGQLRVTRVQRANDAAYEFTLPINFAGQQVGEVLIALSPQSLIEARNLAHWRILFIA
ncbi:MAG: hypothetical protein L3J63_07045, partial [Geopsychrobacter sp.]|nr:hypothetical protein [Geopsychrobacter sp.]